MGGLTTLMFLMLAGWGLGVHDQNADVINEQMLTKFIYHNEGSFNILNLKFLEDYIKPLIFRKFHHILSNKRKF